MILDILLNPLVVLMFFWVVLYLIGEYFNVQRFGFQISPFFLMFKTKKANNFIYKLSKRHPRAWVAFWSLGVAVTMVTLVFALVFLTQNLIGLVFRSPSASPLMPIVPGITVTGLTIVYFVIPFVLVIVVHEFSHGIAANNASIPVKAAGFFLVLILPGAFVEPDEDKLNKASLSAKLRVYAAGSFANLGLAVIGLLLITPVIFSAVISPFYAPSSGVLFQETVPGSPISGHVKPPFVLTGVVVNNSGVVIPVTSPVDFLKVMNQTNPYTNLTLYTDQGVFTVHLAVNPNSPSKGFLGVVMTSAFWYFPPRPWVSWLSPVLPYHLYQIFNWLWVLSFSIGVFNMLPIPFFDGDKIASLIIGKFIPETSKVRILNREIKTGKIVLYALRVFAVTILGLNILFSFILYPFLF